MSRHLVLEKYTKNIVEANQLFLAVGKHCDGQKGKLGPLGNYGLGERPQF